MESFLRFGSGGATGRPFVNATERRIAAAFKAAWSAWSGARLKGTKWKPIWELSG
jgi:hypothetical protein